MQRQQSILYVSIILPLICLFIVQPSISKSIAHRRIELLISFYEVQGAAAADREHKSAACESSPSGCRLKFEFKRCLNGSENPADCGTAVIEDSTTTGCYSCEQDLPYCRNTTRTEQCSLLSSIDGHGKSYDLTISEPSSTIDILASAKLVPVGQGQYLIQAMCHNKTECDYVWVTLLQNSMDHDDH